MSTTDIIFQTDPEAGADFETDLRRVAETVRGAIETGHENNPQFRQNALQRAQRMSEQAQADGVSPAEAAVAAWFFILSLHSEA